MLTPIKNTQPNHSGGKNNPVSRRNLRLQNGRRPAPLFSAHSVDSFSLPITIPAATQHQPSYKQCHSAPVLPTSMSYGNTVTGNRATPPRKAKSTKGTPSRGSPPTFKMRQSSPNFQLQRTSPLGNDLFAMPKYVDSPKANKVPLPPSQWLEEYERKKATSETSQNTSDSESVAIELKALNMDILFQKLTLTGQNSSTVSNSGGYYTNSEPSSPTTTTAAFSSYRTGIRVSPLQLIAAVSAS